MHGSYKKKNTQENKDFYSDAMGMNINILLPIFWNTLNLIGNQFGVKEGNIGKRLIINFDVDNDISKGITSVLYRNLCVYLPALKIGILSMDCQERVLK